MELKHGHGAIRACMNCFSPVSSWIGKKTSDAGVIELGGPLTGVYACDKCGHEGFPLEFDTVKDYYDFINAKGDAPIGQPANDDKRSMASKMVFGEFKLVFSIVAVAFLLFVIIAAIGLLLEKFV